MHPEVSVFKQHTQYSLPPKIMKFSEGKGSEIVGNLHLVKFHTNWCWHFYPLYF